MSYTVKSGDTLSKIAAHYKVSLSSLEKANPQIKDPNRIYVGEHINLPKDTFQKAKPPAKKPTHKPAPPAKKPPAKKPPATNAGSYGEPWKKGTGGQLHGGDTSHYQSKATFEASIKGSQFASIKATEGTSYTDPDFKARWNELGQKVKSGQMKLRMAYCFLDKGNGKAQADHFLKTLGINGKLPAGTRLALDWEASALQSPQTLKDAANEIHKVTGLWPVIYTSKSEQAVAQKTVPGAPMWIAQWSGGTANKSVPFVQYSDGPGYDHDVFNGSQAELDKFAGWSK